MARTYKTEAVVLRSFRLGEADRVLHVYTAERGRVGAVAKGVRRTKSRFGGRLEPLSHVELMLHQGSGELQTVTGADLRASHHESREDPYRLAVGLIGAEAMLRLFTEQEANERAFTALTRFLDRLDMIPSRAPAVPALDPLVLSFQLKLLWVSGYMPHLESCVECGAVEGLVGYLPAAAGAVCRDCGRGSNGTASIPLSTEGVRAIQTLVATPLADAGEAGLTESRAREALAIVRASYEHQGGFRLRTLSA
jgi:DNA repair protein RecO (recombination protein O)